MKKSKLLQAVLGVILAGAPLFAATTVIKSAVNDKNVSAGYSKDSIELNRIVDVINIIETNFVGTKTNKNDKGEKIAENVATPSKEELYKGAVEGVIRKLDDPYSEYLSTEDLKDFTEDMDGEYTGVGMSVSKKKGEPLEVVSPFIGSPAEKVGMRIKEKITKVDGKDILPLTATETVKLLKGKENTKVEVEVVREGRKEPFKVTMTRAKIKLEMVESKMLENKIGYVSLLRFGNNVGTEVEKAIKDLKAKGMRGLIFDLRSNPGGSLQEAQDITSLFVKDNLIVYLKYKDGRRKDYNRTLPYLGDFPLIVLTNEGSASASEIVTGALKDYKRATIIGENTFGKGIVQQVIPLKTNDAIKLTIAQYFTPKGNYIHGKGIAPDIKVDMEELLTLKGYANDSEQAIKNRQKEIEDILIKDKGAEEAKKIIAAGDVQMKRAIQEMNKKLGIK